MSVFEPEVILYADGACEPNPGTGGWAFVLVNTATGEELHECGACKGTTNNRMEMIAVLEGLKKLKRVCRVEIVSDSQYTLKGLESWRLKWKQNGWSLKKNKEKPAKNLDLWQELDKIISNFPEVKYTWVKGHSGHEMNEYCDKMAEEAWTHVRKGGKEGVYKSFRKNTPPAAN